MNEGGQQQRIGPQRKAREDAGNRAARGCAAPYEPAEKRRCELRDGRKGQQADRRQRDGIAILILGYIFYRMIGDTVALASIGLLSFSAIAQFAPAFFGGLVWRSATARGAIAGIR